MQSIESGNAFNYAHSDIHSCKRCAIVASRDLFKCSGRCGRMDVTANKVTVKNWLRGLRSHRVSLERIERSSGRLDNAPPLSFSPKFHGTQHKRFLQAGKGHTERNREISRSNFRLLHQLLHASSTAGQSLHSSPSHKSLNFVSRKQAALRMTAENVALAHRLSHQTSQFSIGKWDEDYVKAQRYRKLIAKPHVLPTVRVKSGNWSLGRCFSGEL